MTASALPPIAQIAKLLGGVVTAMGVLCPGPGHSAGDQSLSVKLDPTDREGFRTHSFAGDDWKACRDHVRKRLGLSEPKPQKKKSSGDGWTTLAEYIYRDENGQPYLKVKKCRDAKGKRQFSQFHRDGSGWAKGKPKGPKVPYRLPELIAAPKTTVIYFCEGEKDADTLAKIGFVATTMSEGSSAEWDQAATPFFAGRHVVVLPDADKPGRAHGQKVAHAIHGTAASVRIVDLYPDRHDGSDVSDWIVNDPAGVRLAKEVKAADTWEPPGPATSEPKEPEEVDADAVEIGRLAKMKPLDYERERKAAAEALGLRASILDRLVQAERAKLGLDGGDDDSGMQGRAVSFVEPEPWPEPVVGAVLLDEISKAIGSHVIMPETSRDACALWAPHTYLTDATMISPRLGITSPTRGCGKTTALDVMSQLVLRPLPAANVSASAIFRVVEGYRPCLLIDEADSFLKDNEELRGVLNSGHRKGGAVLRTVGDDHEPRSFSTYGACAIALIGRLPPTLTDRSVPITLTRRKRDETITPFRLDRVEHLVVLARKLARWTADHAVEIAATEPTIPAGIFNRAADNWRPLLAIAQVAGGDWLDRGQKAALASVEIDLDEASTLEMLLADIRDAFKTDKATKARDMFGAEQLEITSAELVKILVALDGRSWAEMGKARKPITQNRLARMLKALKPPVLPQKVGPENARVSGYLLAHFKDAFERYLPPEGVAQPDIRTEADEIRTSGISQPDSPETGCPVGKCEKPFNDKPLSGCPVAKGGQGQEDDICEYCGRSGDLVEVSFSDGDGPVWLHRGCEAPYRRRLDEGDR